MGTRGPLGSPFGTRQERRKRHGKILYLPGMEGVGPAIKPEWITGHAGEFWDENAPRLERQGRLNRCFQGAFEITCNLVGIFRDFSDRIAADGGDFQLVGKRMRVHPLVKERNSTLKLLLIYLKDFGLTPSSDPRVPRAAPPQKPDRWNFFQFPERSKKP